MSQWITINGKAINLSQFTHADAEAGVVTLRRQTFTMPVPDPAGDLHRAVGLAVTTAAKPDPIKLPTAQPSAPPAPPPVEKPARKPKGK